MPLLTGSRAGGLSGYKTVEKALQLLNAFSHERSELSVAELSGRLGMHKSIVSRLAATLRAWKMLEQDPETRRFRIGAGAFQIGMLFVDRQPLHKIAVPLLGALVQRTHQTAHVSVLDGLTTLVIASVESPRALRVIMRAADRRELHATAAGKLLLGSVPGLLEALLARGELPSLTANTITSKSSLREVVATARRDRLAWNDGESTVGAGAVAAPVFAPSGEIIAAVSCVYPVSVVDLKERRAIAKHVRSTAEEISSSLGR
jgi:DNA-binding IclR family transcriptional regulator